VWGQVWKIQESKDREKFEVTERKGKGMIIYFHEIGSLEI
jgi:hypothetical protein